MMAWIAQLNADWNSDRREFEGRDSALIPRTTSRWLFGHVEFAPDSS